MISPVTSDGLDPAARPAMASTVITLSLDGPTPASQPIRPIWRWRLPLWMRSSSSSGREGDDSIQFADFHRLPGSEPERDNVLERGDLIVAIEVPARPEGRASHYLKVRDRQSYEFALASAAAAVATDGRRIRSARLALGGVAHKPWRLAAAESALRGASLDDSDALKSAIAKSFADARPLAHNGFKVELAQRVALRALQTAGARA